MRPDLNPQVEQLYHAYKPLLFSLSYRMLGSVMDAEDVVQDLFVTVTRSPEVAGLEQPKAYLCRMAANRCIDRLRASRAKRETYVGPWLPEPLLTDRADGDDPAERLLRNESLSTAYLLLLERLSAAERAVFLLRESFGYEYAEIAAMLEKTEINCRKLYSRAAAKMFGAASEELNDAGQREVRKKAAARLLERFVAALTGGDAPAAIQLLADGALLLSDGGGKVSSARRPIEGAEKIARFLLGLAAHSGGLFSVALREVNGWPGLVLDRNGQIAFVFSFAYGADRIESVYLMANPDKLGHLRQPPA